MTIAVCYELDCGGETLATRAIIASLQKRNDIRVVVRAGVPLKNSSLLPYAWWIIKSTAEWIWFILRVGPDTVYTTTYVAGAAAYLTGKPVVFHYHGNRIPERPKSRKGFGFVQNAKRRSVLWLHRMTRRSVYAYVVPSPAAAAKLRGAFGRADVPVHVIPNGIDGTKFSPVPPRLKMLTRKRLGIPQEALVVGLVGRLSPDKNPEEFVRLIDCLRKRDPVVVGLIAFPVPVTHTETDCARQVNAFIARLRLGGVITRIEDAPDMKMIYGVMDVCVSLSRSESFSLVAVEALACGVPFVGRSVGGLHEGVQSFPDGKTDRAAAYLYDMFSGRSGKQVQQLPTHPFRWSECADRIVALFRARNAGYDRDDAAVGEI